MAPRASRFVAAALCASAGGLLFVQPSVGGPSLPQARQAGAVAPVQAAPGPAPEASAGFGGLCAGLALGLAVSLSGVGAALAEESRAALPGSSTRADSYLKGKALEILDPGTPLLDEFILCESGVFFLAQWQSRIFHVQKGMDKHRLLVFDVRNSFLEASLRQMFLQDRILQWLALRAKHPI